MSVGSGIINGTLSSKIILSLILALLILISPIYSQTEKLEKAQIEFEKWQNRVSTLEKEVVADSSRVSDSDRSLCFAILAKVWWKVDQEKARDHIRKSAQLTVSNLAIDDKPNLPDRIKSAQATIDIILKLDEKFGDHLIAQIAEILSDKSDLGVQKENRELAELIVRLGIHIAKTKPSSSVSLGLRSLDYGFATSLPQLIGLLNSQSPTTSEQLYRNAMIKLQGDYSNPAILFEVNLSKYVFDVFGSSGFSTSSRKSFLTNYTDRIALAAQVELERPQRCRIVSFSESIVPRIDEYIPDRSHAVRQNILLCTPYVSNLFQASIDAQTRDDQPKTVDDFIKAAKEARDEVLKGKYWRAALFKLSEEKKFEETISILDSTDGDDLKSLSPIMWGDWRVGAASELTIQKYDADLIPDAYRIIERTPKELRPRVRLDVAKKLSSAKKTTFYSDNLDGMIKDLSGIDIPDIESVGFYLALSNLMLEVRPLESETMFRLLAKHINKVDATNPDVEPEKDWEWDRYYIRLDARLLEFDESGLSSALESISSRRSRVRLKLGLLESSLIKYTEAQKLVASLSKTPEKAKKN